MQAKQICVGSIGRLSRKAQRLAFELEHPGGVSEEFAAQVTEVRPETDSQVGVHPHQALIEGSLGSVRVEE